MKSSALILGLLFFVHSFAPEHTESVFAMAGVFFMRDHGQDYDGFIVDLLDQYNPSFRATMVLTKKPVTSHMARVYWPKDEELGHPVMKVMREAYGMVIIDITEKESHEVPTDLLYYANEIMRYGGKLIVTDGHNVFIVMEKE